MNNFQRNIYRAVNENPEASPTLESGSISSISQVLPDGSCDLILNSICYINTAVNGVITSGDTVYQDISGTNPILGENRYYKILLVNSYIALINDLGVISVHQVCT